MPLCRISSSVSGDAKTETCGEKARNITSRISLPPVGSRVERLGEGDLIVEPVGEKVEAPLLIGVIVPESLGDPVVWVGRDVVEANRFESEALERRYGRLAIEARGDFVGLVFEFGMVILVFDSSSLDGKDVL